MDKEFESLELKYKTKTEKLFKSKLEKLFEENEFLESFSFAQYTPSFCDGDPCRFQFCEEPITINKFNIENEEYEEYELEKIEFDPSLLYDYRDKISNFLTSFKSSLFSTLFGQDNLEITIYRDGTITTDYYDCGY